MKLLIKDTTMSMSTITIMMKRTNMGDWVTGEDPATLLRSNTGAISKTAPMKRKMDQQKTTKKMMMTTIRRARMKATVPRPTWLIRSIYRSSSTPVDQTAKKESRKPPAQAKKAATKLTRTTKTTKTRKQKKRSSSTKRSPSLFPRHQPHKPKRTHPHTSQHRQMHSHKPSLNPQHRRRRR